MGNLITNRCHADVSDLKMSNALSNWFFVALALSTSALAATPAQATLARWLAGCDEAWFGLGALGFDVCDLPWDHLVFSSQQDFLVEATTDAMTGERWREFLDLDDERYPFVVDALGRFRRLVEPLRVQDLPTVDQHVRGGGESSADLASFERCPLHGAFLHEAPSVPVAPDISRPWGYRCIVCNNSSE